MKRPKNLFRNRPRNIPTADIHEMSCKQCGRLLRVPKIAGQRATCLCGYFIEVTTDVTNTRID